MEELSTITGEKWSKLSKEEKRIYYEVYEIASKRYTINNNTDSSPFLALEYNPCTSKNDSELSYSKLKEIFDMLMERKYSSPHVSVPTTEKTAP